MTAPNVVEWDQVMDLDWHDAFAAATPADRPLVLVDVHLLFDRPMVDVVRDVCEVTE